MPSARRADGAETEGKAPNERRHEHAQRERNQTSDDVAFHDGFPGTVTFVAARCANVRLARTLTQKENSVYPSSTFEFPHHCTRDEACSSLYIPPAMERVVLISGDFVRTGGMDMPNFAVAHYFAEWGVSVHVVAFRIAEELQKHPNVHWHRVPKPLNSYTFGLPLLDHLGRKVAGRLLA